MVTRAGKVVVFIWLFLTSFKLVMIVCRLLSGWLVVVSSDCVGFVDRRRVVGLRGSLGVGVEEFLSSRGGEVPSVRGGEAVD